ncbi:MAG: 70 kDa peptidylprolyl isomerase [uncultured bacterium]|nr:MAG: 70 kDa peptidylprolyl isomerase [uncultured bacterium]
MIIYKKLMNRILKLSSIFFLSMVAFSCAREVEEGQDDIEKRVLDAYIHVVHKDTLQPTASGLYIIPGKSGDGLLVESLNGVYVRYSTLDLKENYISTTDENIAKRVGGFSYGSYYGPYLLEIGYNTSIKGLEEGMKGMKEGGTARFIIPSWLSDYENSGSNKIHTVTTIYDVEIIKVVKDMKVFQTDTLEAYSNKYWGGIDSITNNYYFKTISSSTGDSIKVNSALQYYYVGKLLDGFVFDTNIEDTARKYNIYDATKSYLPLDLTAHVETETGDGKVIRGMAKSILKMKYGEKAITFFSSEYGYGSTEKPFGRYQPMFFYIDVLKKK